MRHKRAIVLAVIAGHVICTATFAVQVRRIVITDSEFVPYLTYAEREDTLRCVNSTVGPQTITTGYGCQPEGTLDIGDIAPGDSVSYVINFGGSGEQYGFFSRHHCPGPEGTLRVGPDLPVQLTSWGRVRALYR